LETDLPKGNLKRARNMETNSLNSSANIFTQDKILENHITQEMIRYRKVIRKKLKKTIENQGSKKKDTIMNSGSCFKN
jgi:UDP-N-acetylenolpyruvoylglucosamine reductase